MQNIKSYNDQTKLSEILKKDAEQMISNDPRRMSRWFFYFPALSGIRDEHFLGNKTRGNFLGNASGNVPEIGKVLGKL